MKRLILAGAFVVFLLYIATKEKPYTPPVDPLTATRSMDALCASEALDGRTSATCRERWNRQR